MQQQLCSCGTQTFLFAEWLQDGGNYTTLLCMKLVRAGKSGRRCNYNPAFIPLLVYGLVNVPRSTNSLTLVPKKSSLLSFLGRSTTQTTIITLLRVLLWKLICKNLILYEFHTVVKILIKSTFNFQLLISMRLYAFFLFSRGWAS